METTYKILKYLIVILLIAVVAVGAWKLVGGQENGQPTIAPAVPVTTIPETSVSEIIVPETTTANTVPDITVYDIDGNAHNLSDFRGKPVILNFWASWCPPCKAEMPDFEAAYKIYGDEIHFLIVNLTDGRSETVETASAYIAQQGYTFPVYYDTDMDAAVTYSVSSIPMSYFIDAQGNMVDSHLGMMSAEALQEAIDQLIPAE